MAQGKKSFVLYCDLIDAIDHLTTLEKGKLFEHLLDYVNDKDPVLDDRVLLGTWKHIQQSLKRDLKRYEDRAQRSRENGALGGRPKKPKKPSGLNGNPDKPKKPDSVTVTDTVTVNVSDIKKKRVFTPPTYPEFMKHAVARLGEEYPKHKKVIDLKYHAYEDANWHDGNGKPIKIWKTTLNNFLIRVIK